jgi:hypothetical protein
MFLEVSLAPFPFFDPGTWLTAGAEWASGDVSQVVEWGPGTIGDVVYHKFFRQVQEEFRESSEIASWGNWYLATRSGSGVSLSIY